MARRTHRSPRSSGPARPSGAAGSAARAAGMRIPDGAACPCGAGPGYAECCGRYHRGGAAAPTAEALMRSRYSAFAVGDEAYLLRTWHPRTRPARLGLDPRLRWTGLEIVAVAGGSAFHPTGTVAFRAHHTDGGTAEVLAEHSRFERVDGAWVYVDGDLTG
ncbi:YchJ family protein [Streptomyces sp. NPDC058045]|uniref:YchJ family protein n=1 Tax=Streptomyces sp. NPDC058045 TaxID=3346311 RepID=UPI0036E243DE